MREREELEGGKIERGKERGYNNRKEGRIREGEVRWGIDVICVTGQQI